MEEFWSEALRKKPDSIAKLCEDWNYMINNCGCFVYERNDDATGEDDEFVEVDGLMYEDEEEI